MNNKKLYKLCNASKQQKAGKYRKGSSIKQDYIYYLASIINFLYLIIAAYPSWQAKAYNLSSFFLAVCFR